MLFSTRRPRIRTGEKTTRASTYPKPIEAAKSRRMQFDSDSLYAEQGLTVGEPAQVSVEQRQVVEEANNCCGRRISERLIGKWLLGWRRGNEDARDLLAFTFN